MAQLTEMAIEDDLIASVLQWFSRVKKIKPIAEWGESAELRIECTIHEHENEDIPIYNICVKEILPTEIAGEYLETVEIAAGVSREDKFKQLLK